MVDKSIILIALAHDKNTVEPLRLDVPEIMDTVNPVNGQVVVLIQRTADSLDGIHQEA
ncbi:hypothetical protein D3C73_1447930 [compost metagenome]